MNLEIRLYDATQRTNWDEVVRASRNGTFLHLRDFLEYHAHRFVERSIVLYQDGKAIAVFPANAIDEAIISHQGLTFGGLIYGIEIKAAEIINIFEVIVEFYRDLGFKKIIYKAIPHIFHSYFSEYDLYALFRIGAQVCRRDLSIAMTLEDRPPMSSLRRRMIRKGGQAKLAVKSGDFYQEFYSILEEVLSRHAAIPVHSIDEMRLLAGRFPNNISLYGAFDNEELCAGVWLFDFGHVVHTQYLASSTHGRTCGALDFLISDIIDRYACKKALSFGISTEQSGLYLNEGLASQKEGFGGRGTVLDWYEVDL